MVSRSRFRNVLSFRGETGSLKRMAFRTSCSLSPQHPISVGNQLIQQQVETDLISTAGAFGPKRPKAVVQAGDVLPGDLLVAVERRQSLSGGVRVFFLAQEPQRLPQEPHPFPEARPRQPLEGSVHPVVPRLAREVLGDRHRGGVLEVDFEEIIGRVVSLAHLGGVPVPQIPTR